MVIDLLSFSDEAFNREKTIPYLGRFFFVIILKGRGYAPSTRTKIAKSARAIVTILSDMVNSLLLMGIISSILKSSSESMCPAIHCFI